MLKRILSIASLCLLAACNSGDKNDPSAVILDLRLGIGSGSSFVSGALSTSSAFGAGESGQIGVNIVDLNDSSNLYTAGNKTVTFSSSCASSGQAFFTSGSVSTSSGLAVTTYTNSSCSGEDVITAVLSDDASKLAQAQVTMTNYVLGLGSGTGIDFAEAVIATSDTDLDFGDSATLSVDIVNTNGSNARFEDGSVTVVFSSSCVTAGLAAFSSAQVSSSDGSISTEYTANGCAAEDEVTATLQGQDETATVTLTTQSHDLRIGNDTGVAFSEGVALSSVANLSATGQTVISVSVVDINSDSALYTDEAVNIEFGSDCVDDGTASFSSASASTSAGLASATYTANGCRGEDIVTATISGSSQSAEVSINIAEPELGSISSVVPENTVLAIQGFSTDTLPSSTAIGFMVLDKSGHPIEGKEVRFSLSGGTGGVSLNRSSAQSDSDGMVSVFANSGTAHTNFRVTAETDVFNEDGSTTGRVLQTTSTAISVTTGLPSARSFGSGVSVHNPWGWGRISSGSDEGSFISATASDLYGGAALNDNTITFSTLGGRLETASCQLENGICGVRWQSSELYRPIARLLAYSLGEETFDDLNGNGQYDINEVFYPLDEPYRDDNGNGSYDLGEFFVDSNLNGQWDAAVDYQSAVYRGASCSDEAKERGHCSRLAHLFSQSAVIMSSDVIGVSFVETEGRALAFELNEVTNKQEPVVTIPTSGSAYFVVNIFDENSVIPPAGTALSIACNSSDISYNSDQMPAEVPNEFIPTAYSVLMNVTAEAVDDTEAATVFERQTTCFVNVEPESSLGIGVGFIVKYFVNTESGSNGQ